MLTSRIRQNPGLETPDLVSNVCLSCFDRYYQPLRPRITYNRPKRTIGLRDCWLLLICHNLSTQAFNTLELAPMKSQPVLETLMMLPGILAMGAQKRIINQVLYVAY